MYHSVITIVGRGEEGTQVLLGGERREHKYCSLHACIL